MSDDKIIHASSSQGEILVNPDTGVVMFTEYALDECRQSPDGKHDFTGEWIEFPDGGSATCKYCGLDAMTYSLRCMP